MESDIEVHAEHAVRAERGAALVEYAVLVSMMAAVAVASVMLLGDKLTEIINNIFIGI